MMPVPGLQRRRANARTTLVFDRKMAGARGQPQAAAGYGVSESHWSCCSRLSIGCVALTVGREDRAGLRMIASTASLTSTPPVATASCSCHIRNTLSQKCVNTDNPQPLLPNLMFETPLSCETLWQQITVTTNHGGNKPLWQQTIVATKHCGNKTLWIRNHNHMTANPAP